MPVRISRDALAWAPEAGAFALDGETLPKLLERLARTFLGSA